MVDRHSEEPEACKEGKEDVVDKTVPGEGGVVVEGLETLGRESSMVDNDGEEVKSAPTDESLFRF